jgi:hypothetical protein
MGGMLSREKLIRIAAVLGAVAALIALVVVFGLAMLPRAQAKPENYIAYSLEGLDNIPENKILYREAAAIPVPADALGGLCLLPGGGLAVAGDSSVFIFNKNRALTRTIAVAAPVIALAAQASVSSAVLYLGMRDHIEVYGVDGRQKDEWASLGEKALIASVAVSNDSIYAADAGNKNIACWDSGGRLKRFIGLKNPDGNGFLVPGTCFDIAPAGDNALWAVDPGRLRVVKISADGGIRAAWGTPSPALDGFSGCCNPVNIALFPDGSFVVQEKGLLRIKLYDRNGRFTGAVAGPKSFHESLTSLDLAVSQDGTVYAVDTYRKAVRVFVKKEGGR